MHVNFANAKSGLRPVAEVVCMGNHYEITLEADAPGWVLEHLVQPLDRVANIADGGVTLTIRHTEGPLR